jgi:hypothetical protein
LQLDHIWRGSLLAAIGWSPSAINDPINLELLCSLHHADKTAHETQLLAADDYVHRRPSTFVTLFADRCQRFDQVRPLELKEPTYPRWWTAL